jgi:uncharacterized protein (TIGR02147 family)
MERPVIGRYDSPAEFVRDMLRHRKATEKGFSVHQATRSLRRISPALVSLVIQKKRSLTLDRVEEFARLLQLNASEKIFFRNWVALLEDKDFNENSSGAHAHVHVHARARKDVGVGILSDWLNVYIKDFFQIAKVRENPELIGKQLLPVATPKRVARAIEFLLREGYLRRTIDGKIVVETRLTVAEPRLPSRRIRQFHKGALGLAKLALDLYPKEERLANTLLIPLDEKGHADLMELIAEFAEKLKDFAARKAEEGNRLYQLIINLSPVGRKLE